MEDSGRFSYFFLGLGIGVAIGVLFAPKAGDETRHYIKAKADEGKDYIKRRSEEVRGSASTLVERGKEAVNRQKDQLSAAVEAGKQAYREAVGGVGEKGPEPQGV
ncbi:MAG: YtxH domain-containing protein [Bryobacteraceae bacterium]|nr:YtxH domain-containing protein [Bryobacteraceae bacterium]